MARPTDWSPLAGSDPVPGDPQRISQEAAHLASVAQEIQGQVARLRAIATGNSAEKGLHVDKLKSAASDVADQLDKVVGRYQKTSTALSGWVPELEYAQAQSLKALANAQDAAWRQRSYQPVSYPAGYKETPQDKQADQQRKNALNQANSDLAAARAMLDAATSYRDNKGSETRNKIENAINDGMKDSFWDDLGGFFSSAWDDLKGLIHQYAWLLKDIATVLEFVATALAIAALFISGIGILLIVGILAGALLLRTVLALNGDGSWTDVALDAVSLATLGLGEGASYILGRFAEGAEQSASGFLQGERTIQELGGMSKLADDPAAAELLGDGSPAEAIKGVLGPLEESTPGERFLNAGSEEVAANAAKLGRMTQMFADSPIMRSIASDTKVVETFARVNYLGALVPDWGDKIAGGIELDGPHGVLGIPGTQVPIKLAGPWSDGYNQWKDQWKPEGAVW